MLALTINTSIAIAEGMFLITTNWDRAVDEARSRTPLLREEPETIYRTIADGC